MSIEKMSLVNIVGGIDDMDRAMTVCCESGCFHPENASQYISDLNGGTILQETNPFNPLIKRIVDLSYKMNFQLSYQDKKGLKLGLSEFEDAVSKIEDQFDKLRSKKEELAQQVSVNEQALIQLNHMKGLAEKFDDLFAWQSCCHPLGSCQTTALKSWIITATNHFSFLHLMLILNTTGRLLCTGRYEG